jgi:hypothetical protein
MLEMKNSIILPLTWCLIVHPVYCSWPHFKKKSILPVAKHELWKSAS